MFHMSYFRERSHLIQHFGYFGVITVIYTQCIEQKENGNKLHQATTIIKYYASQLHAWKNVYVIQDANPRPPDSKTHALPLS